MLQAEVRSYYFADLAARYTREKQIITGVSFFLSSGAAATLGAQLPHWIPLVLSITVAIVTAYSMAVGLDRRVIALSRLHTQWNQLASDYEHLWNHLDDPESDHIFQDLLERGGKASESSLELPYDQTRLNKWTDIVFSRFQETT